MKTEIHPQIKITTKKEIHSALYVLECPICSKWVASASEKSFLPEFSTCDGSESNVLEKK